MPTLIIINQHNFGSCSHGNQRRNGISTGKEELKLCLQMTLILYIENPKDTTRKSQELINEFSKVTGYKITTQKSLAFLYINIEKSEREIKETIPFTTATKRIKYLEINLLKETNDLYADNTDERH